MTMFAPHGVHLLMSEYFDAETQIALAVDWKLPLTFEKKVFTHPLLEVEHSADFVASASPSCMIKQYVDGKLTTALIQYQIGITTIQYINDKIDGYIVLQHNNYDTYHRIVDGKYINGIAITSNKTDIRLIIERDRLRSKSYINYRNELTIVTNELPYLCAFGKN